MVHSSLLYLMNYETGKSYGYLLAVLLERISKHRGGWQHWQHIDGSIVSKRNP